MCMRSLGISIVSLLTQHRYSALMLAAKESRTEVVSLLLKTGAKVDLQDEVMYCQGIMCMRSCGFGNQYYVSPHTAWILCTDVGCRVLQD